MPHINFFIDSQFLVFKHWKLLFGLMYHIGSNFNLMISISTQPHKHMTFLILIGFSLGLSFTHKFLLTLKKVSYAIHLTTCGSHMVVGSSLSPCNKLNMKFISFHGSAYWYTFFLGKDPKLYGDEKYNIKISIIVNTIWKF